jgi:hypothetical protein
MSANSVHEQTIQKLSKSDGVTRTKGILKDIKIFYNE